MQFFFAVATLEKMKETVNRMRYHLRITNPQFYCVMIINLKCLCERVVIHSTLDRMKYLLCSSMI